MESNQIYLYILGSCFPDVVITRVLSVGLKSQEEMAKVNSVVGILNHLGATHKQEIQTCVLKILQNSEDPLTIPFLLNLSSLSDLMASTVISVAAEVLNEESANKIADLVPIWDQKGVIDTKEDNFTKLTVNLLMKHGKFSLILQLLNFSSEDWECKDVMNGSRHILENLLVELHNFVHTGFSKNECNNLLKEASLQWDLLTQQFLFDGDNYQKKIVSMLLNCIFLQEGRMLTAMALQKGLNSASNDEELSSILLLIKDVEMWMPEVVELAIQLCFRTKKSQYFLENLGKILHYQNESNKDVYIIETDIMPIVKLHHTEVVDLLNVPELLPQILKILNFVPLANDELVLEEEMTTALLLKSVNNLSKALFLTLKKEQNEEELALIIEHLQILANSVTGLPMVLRCLLSGAMSPSISPIFGGLTETSKSPKNSSLYDENLKFGAMPTHPLGTSTVFHAGVIGKVIRYCFLAVDRE